MDEVVLGSLQNFRFIGNYDVIVNIGDDFITFYFSGFGWQFV